MDRSCRVDSEAAHEKLWLIELKWNDQLPSDVQNEWDKFRKEFKSIDDIRIRRHCFIENHVSIELHAFCDASIVGYGAVIYTYSYDQIGNYQVSIICSKSRVAPKNQKTLARLEMCASALLARLVDRMMKTFVHSFDQVTLWSDSTIVLHWITMLPSRLSTYVGNRVAVVQELTHKYVWKHIKGTDNPADIISRGLMPCEIAACQLWWNGPAFFQTPKSEWKDSIVEVSDATPPECLSEVKNSFVVTARDNLFEFIENRFSRIDAIIVCFVFIRRFIHNSHNSQGKKSGPVSVEERDEAEANIMRIVQRNFFSSEIRVLQRPGGYSLWCSM
jgi:Pao retrotransposon peptidase